MSQEEVNQSDCEVAHLFLNLVIFTLFICLAGYSAYKAVEYFCS